VHLRIARARLAKLLSKAGDGVYLSEHLAGDGAIIFEHACRMGIEGIVSKRRDFPYRSGRSKCWIKVKNPASPAALKDSGWEVACRALGASSLTTVCGAQGVRHKSKRR
jgi:ATP-dependent DNA ligase